MVTEDLRKRMWQPRSRPPRRPSTALVTIPDQHLMITTSEILKKNTLEWKGQSRADACKFKSKIIIITSTINAKRPQYFDRWNVDSRVPRAERLFEVFFSGAGINNCNMIIYVYNRSSWLRARRVRFWWDRIVKFYSLILFGEAIVLRGRRTLTKVTTTI